MCFKINNVYDILKILKIIILSVCLFLSVQPVFAVDKEEAAKAGGAAVVGAGVGYGAVAVTGVTAAAMTGTGAGFGAAAGPVGAVIGAVVGLAGYGLYRLFGDDELKNIGVRLLPHKQGNKSNFNESVKFD